MSGGSYYNKMPKGQVRDKKSLTRGFTLIELAIVLIIIGLVAGGVLVGRELVHAAELRKVITEVDAIRVATATFRGKYGNLPGDIPDASKFFAGASNGDGNGIVGVTAGSLYEGNFFWDHLSRANLLQQHSSSLSDSVSYFIGYFTFYSENAICLIGTVANDVANYYLNNDIVVQMVQTTSQGAMNGPDAKYIDSKVDDGLPSTGRMKATTGLLDCSSDSMGSCYGSQNYPTTCLAASGNAYGASTEKNCLLTFKLF